MKCSQCGKNMTAFEELHKDWEGATPGLIVYGCECGNKVFAINGRILTTEDLGNMPVVQRFYVELVDDTHQEGAVSGWLRRYFEYAKSLLSR